MKSRFDLSEVSTSMATVTSTIRIGPADHGRSMTLEEFREAEVEEGYRYELARGVLEVSEVPNDPHGVIVFRLYCALAAYHQAHPGVIHRFGGGAELQLLVTEMVSGRHPDAAVSLLATPKDDRGRNPASFAVE